VTSSVAVFEAALPVKSVNPYEKILVDNKKKKSVQIIGNFT